MTRDTGSYAGIIKKAMFISSAIAFIFAFFMYIFDAGSGKDINPLAILALTFASFSWMSNLVGEQDYKKIIKRIGLTLIGLYVTLGLFYIAWLSATDYYSLTYLSPPPADIFLYVVGFLSLFSSVLQIYQAIMVGKVPNSGNLPIIGGAKEF